MLHQARLDAPGTLHHVMIRGIETSPVFKDNQVKTMVPDNDNWAFDMEENLVRGGKENIVFPLPDPRIYATPV
jgi:hypothetical protein